MLANIIARVDAKSTPVQAMIPKGEAITNMLTEWQMDDFEDDADLAVEDGTDAETFSNATENRRLAQVYATKFRDTAQVSDLAENVSDVAGLKGGELAEAVMKKLKKLGRSIEAALCGDQETQAESAGNPYKVRGLGLWIQNGAQATLPVDPAYRTPTDSINSTATASLTEDDIQGVITSVYQETGEIGEFDLPCGPTLRRAISKMVTRVSAATNTFSQIRTYNTEFKGMLGSVVTQFDGDFGKVNIHPTLFNATARFGGSDTVSKCRGYLLKMSLLSLHYRRQPRVKQLEDRGGGPRFLVDAIWASRVKNPLGLGAFKATS